MKAKRIISIALCLIMMLTAVPMSGFAALANELSLDFIESEASFDDVNSIKVTPEGITESDLRDPMLSNTAVEKENGVHGVLVDVGQYYKTYLDDSGRYTTVITGIPNYFEDDQGNAVSYDNSLVQEERKFSSDVITNKSSDIDVSLSSDFVSEGLSFSYNGVQIELLPTDGDYSAYSVVNNAIRYNNVYDGIDVQYTVEELGVSEFIILNKYVDRNEFSYKIKTNGNQVELSDNTILVKEAGSDKIAYTISAPFMSDAAGETSQNVFLSLNGDILTVRADAEWLSDVGRAYPVIIDPDITTNGALTTRAAIANGVYSSDKYGYAGWIGNDATGDNGVIGSTRLMISINNEFFAAVPDGIVVNNATLYLRQYGGPYKNRRGNVVANDLQCFRVTTSWSMDTIKYGDSIGREFQDSKDNRVGDKFFDISEAVTAWCNGEAPQYGLCVDVSDGATGSGAAFYTATSGNSGGQEGFSIDQIPRIDITYELPNPVDDGYPLNETTIHLRTLSKSDPDGVLAFQGTFADGLAQPYSSVHYWLNDDSISYQNQIVNAIKQKHYPNTIAEKDKEIWKQLPAGTTKYRRFVSNWQTEYPFVNPEYNKLYYYSAQATKNGESGNIVESDRFLVYKITQYDNLQNIAAYYGVPINQIARDNHVQDMLLVDGNTIIIINPAQNSEKPYNPPALTDDEKARIDGLLMGRGKHCEFGFEPVNLNTGNFYMNQTDVSIADYNGNFAIDRTYNSKGAGINSVFGRGWQFEYSESITKRADGSIAYRRGDGSTVSFYPDGNGGYRCDTGYYLELTPVVIGTKTATFDGVYEENIDNENIEAKEKITSSPVTYNIYEYEIKSANGEVRRFSSQGLLTKITDEKGFVTAIAYDENGNFASITSPAGQIYSITSAADGKIKAVGLPNGKSLSYSYDDNDNLVGYTNALGYTVTYRYDDNHLMTSWSDPEENVIVTNVYDEDGRVTKQTDANGNDTLFAYGDHTTTTTDANGNTTVYTYDDQYRTTKIAYADGTFEEKRYDADNNLASVKDRNGNTTAYTYNADGFVLTETRPVDNAVKTYTYNNKNDVTKIVDFDGLSVSYTYDEKRNVTSVTAKDGGVTEYEYDANCRMTKSTDANGNSVKYAYDGIWVSAITDAENATNTFYYDTMGNVVTKIDALGNQTRYFFDAAGRNTGYQTADDNTVTYTYDKAGCMTSLKNAAGYVYTYEYDGMGNVVTLTDPLENAAKFTYDGLYNTTATAYDENHKTSATFDAFSQTLTETDEEGGVTAYTYDGAGNILTKTDANGNQSSFTYDLRFNKVQTATDAMGGVSTYTYDTAGNLISFVDANGNETTYTYDNAGRLLTITNPNGRVDSYQYDKTGHVTEEKIGDDKTTYTYNNVYQLTQKQFANGATIRYAYDANGNKLTETDSADATTTYTYDVMGRVATKEDGIGRKTTYTYDANGNVLKEEYSNGGKTENVYDALDRLCKKTDSLGNSTTYTYDNVGNMMTATDARDAVTSYTYTKTGLVASTTDPMGGTSVMEYDPVGNMTKITDAEGFVATIAYDKLNRTSVMTDALGLKTTYTYDAVGNLIEDSDNNGGKNSYVYSPAGYLTEKTDALENTTTFEYDLQGRLTKTTDANGAETVYTYDVMGNLLSMTDAEGGETKMEYDIVGNNTKQIDANGGEYSFTYDKVGRIVKSVDPLKFTTQYQYNDFDQVTETIDANGGKTIKKYDIGGNLIADIDANGHKTSYAYDAVYNLTQVTYADNTTNTFAYDLNGNLIKATDGNKNAVSYAYNGLGYRTEETDAKGNKTEYTFNANGDVLTETDALNHVTNYAYDKSGRLEKQTLANGALYGFSYDALGRPTKQTLPEGQFDQFTYDAVGNTTLVTDETDRKTAYTYDKLGRLLTSTDAKGNKTVFEYDKLGNLVAMTTPNGNKTTYAYDANNQLLSAAEPASALVKYSYDAIGNLTATDEGGRITGFAYDKVGNLTSETNALGKTRTYSYDALDRMVKETDYKGHSATYTYDANDNMTSFTNRLGELTAYTYDQNNNLTKTVDAADRKVSYTYNELNWLVDVQEGAAHSNYEYDAVGNLTKAGGYTYTYNLNGDMLTATNAIGNVTEYVYNQNGMLAKIVNADKSTVNYDYDEIDALVSKTYDDGEQAALFAYDKDGNRVSMTDVAGVTSYEYDEAGRVTAIILYNGVSRVTYKYNEFGELVELGYPDATKVAYAYDDLGRMTEMTDRDGGKVTYAYDDNGNLTEVHRANGTTAIIKYDNQDRVTSIENRGYIKIGSFFKKSVTSSRYTYGYDGSGNITSETVFDFITDCSLIGLIKYLFVRLKNEHSVKNYTYDARNQLIRETEKKIRWIYLNEKTHEKDYQYDDAGNRIAKTEDGKKTTYTYNEAGQLLSETTGKKTTYYKYDVNGNLISEKTPIIGDKGCEKTYSYDNENRLKAVKENGTLLMAMLYDGDGMRTFTAEFTANPCEVVKNAFELSPIPGSFNKSAGNSGSDGRSSEADQNIYDLLLVPNGVKSSKFAFYDLTQYINNVNTEYAQVLLEKAANGKTKAVYEYGMFRERAEIDGKDYTYEYDGRGSVSSLLDSSARKVATYKYDAFGVTTSAGLSIDNPYQYNAEYTDKLTGFQYLRARYYRAETGSFITADTYAGRVTSPLSLNRYTYVLNNPMISRDPSGHFGLGTLLVGIVIVGVLAYTGKKTYDEVKDYNAQIDNKTKEIKDFESNYAIPEKSSSSKGNTFSYYNASKKKTFYFKDEATKNSYQKLCEEYERLNTKKVSTIIHTVIDDLGFIPAIGDLADVANGVYYLAEGETLDAGLSFAGAIPFADGVTVLRKGLKEVGEEAAEEVVQKGVKEVTEEVTEKVTKEVKEEVTEKATKEAKEEVVENATGTSKKLFDGAKMTTDEALDSAEDFLGKGYKEVEPGRFVSADGTKQVRMKDNDILGKHGGGPHMNFEILAPDPKSGKMKVIQNLHIYLED